MNNNEKVTKLNEIASEIDEWGSKNFPIKLPNWGIVEEVGEMTHCLLKRAQKIRGFDDRGKFVTKLTDAIADTAIYTLHAIYVKGHKIMEAPVGSSFDLDDTEELGIQIGQLAESASWCVLDFDMHPYAGKGNYEGLLDQLASFAASIDMDLVEIIESTWNRVKQRDWSKDRENAHTLVNEN